MAEKKTAKKSSVKKALSKAKATKSKESKTTKAKTTKAKTTKTKTSKTTKSTKKPKEEPIGDMGIVIVDDDITIDQEKINEERRAYLEEARSQEATD